MGASADANRENFPLARRDADGASRDKKAEELRRVITACLQVDEAARPSAAALKADPLFVRARELEELVRPWKAQVTVLKIERDKINFELAEEREAHEKDTSALALARTRVKELEAQHDDDVYPEKRVLEGHTSTVCGVAALADGRVVSASADNTLRVWNATTGACERVLEGHTNVVFGVAALADGRVVSASRDRTLIVWRL